MDVDHRVTAPPLTPAKQKEAWPNLLQLMARGKCRKGLKMAAVDELGDGCSDNDLDPHLQRCSQRNPGPAPLSSPMASMCAAKNYRSVSSSQPCQGISAPQTAEEPGSAVSDLIRAPLASGPALHNQFLMLFLMLLRALSL